ncbi:MAG: tetratricopeptide repeat-containing sensor histidine kinase [Chloroherpetonaceae bacterium]|nr:tetratricopeptide repeat-containing sensor histidine kinase [Chloroherpetonaceae bacterium]
MKQSFAAVSMHCTYINFQFCIIGSFHFISIKQFSRFLFSIVFIATSLFSQENSSPEIALPDSLSKPLKRWFQEGIADSNSILALNRASIYFENILPDSAISLSRLSIELAEKVKFKKGEAEALFNLAYAADNKGNFQNAIENYLKALSIEYELQDTAKILTTYNRLVSLFGESENSQLREKYYQEAITLTQNPLYDEIKARIHVSKAIYTDDLTEKISLYRTAVNMLEKLDFPNRLSLYYSFLGRALARNKQYEEGEVFLWKAIKLAEKIGDKRKIADSYYGLAEMNVAATRLTNAVSYFKLAIKNYTELGKSSDKTNAAFAYRELSKISLGTGDLVSAIDFGKSSLRFTQEAGEIGLQTEIYEYLSSLYEKKKDFSTALAYHKRFAELADSTKMMESNEKISSLELRLRNQLKDREIELLRTENALKASEAEQNKLLRNALIGIIILTIVVVILIYRQFVIKKRSELTLSEKNAQLNEAVVFAERERLRAEEASIMKTEFLNIAAHDLKNPLQTVLGFSSLIGEHKSANEDINRMSRVVQSSTVRMIRIIDEVLNLANIESPTFELYKVNTDLGLLLSQVIEQNLPNAEKKGQKLNLTLSTSSFQGNLFADIDLERMHEVLDNLISNAIKYSNPQKSIWVSAERLEGKIVIKVKDEGLGLTEEDTKRLFGKFSKLSARPTGGESSTGLGLAIVKQLVELHGGSIFAQSDGKNKGSTFVLILPAAPIS